MDFERISKGFSRQKRRNDAAQENCIESTRTAYWCNGSAGIGEILKIHYIRTYESADCAAYVCNRDRSKGVAAGEHNAADKRA